VGAVRLEEIDSVAGEAAWHAMKSLLS